MKRPIGLIIIASYFTVEALFGLYKFFRALQVEELIYTYFIILLISLGFIISGVGLFLQRGWGRNFALCFNFLILFNGIRNLLSYFVVESKISIIIKGLVSLFIATLIFIYLLNKNIKEKFPKNPVSLIILGFFLSMYGIIQRTGYALIDYSWLAMAIIGFSILFKGAKQLREK